VKKNLTTSLFAGLLAVSTAASQTAADTSVYRLHPKVDIPVAAAGISLGAVAYIASQNLPERSIAEVEALGRPRLIQLDEQAISNHAGFADRASDWLAVGSLAMPLALLADAHMRRDAFCLAALAVETGIITQSVTLATKRLVLRNRPYVFNDKVPSIEKTLPDARLSFFSGHTSTTASMSFFTAKVWSDYHPDSRWKPVVWAGAATLPALTGYLRYRAGKHYFTDVAAGYAVGALVGYFVPHFHKQKRKHGRKRLSFSVPATDDGTAAIALHFRP
jgi:membrane-associated phospholipid phosphatase